jgi:flagellar basal-body rod modification protein FlgD
MATEAAALPSNLLTKATPSTAATAGTSTGTNQTMGAADFLGLLTTELKNQDPLNPVDSTQSVAQLAQFSALQATTSLSTQFTNFESNFAVSQASGLLGQSVTVSTTDAGGNSSTVAGTVKAIQVVKGAPEFTMVDSSGNAIADTNGVPIEFTSSQIIAISK